jgi:hypothetical protein
MYELQAGARGLGKARDRARRGTGRAAAVDAAHEGSCPWRGGPWRDGDYRACGVARKLTVQCGTPSARDGLGHDESGSVAPSRGEKTAQPDALRGADRQRHEREPPA